MEGEKKGNTATLLVAVVGATFAYFSANAESNNGNVTVSATTASAADVFQSSGSGEITLDITADKMQEAAGKNDYTVIANSDNDSTLTVSLEAGSSKATCTYDVIYTPSTAFTPSAEAAAANPALREFDISGTSTHNAANNFSNVDAKGSAVVTLKTGAVIEDTYESTSVATTDTWTFTANFYNLAVSQNDNINKSFGGVISITNVNCTNAAVQSGD